MQYLLTQDELTELHGRITKEAEARLLNELRDVGKELLQWVPCRIANDYCDDCPMVNMHNVCTKRRDYSQ